MDDDADVRAARAFLDEHEELREVAGIPARCKPCGLGSGDAACEHEIAMLCRASAVEALEEASAVEHEIEDVLVTWGEERSFWFGEYGVETLTQCIKTWLRRRAQARASGL